MTIIRDPLFNIDFPTDNFFQFMEEIAFSDPKMDWNAASPAQRKAHHLGRLRRTFNNAAAGHYQDMLSKHYKDRNLIDLSALHLQRGVWAEYNRTYEGGKPVTLPAPVIAAPLDPSTAAVFHEQVTRGMNDLPTGLRQLLAESGLQTHLACRLADVDPDYAHQKVQGELTNEFIVAAYYSGPKNTLTLFQEYRDPENRDNYISLVPRVRKFYLHECAHALDKLAGHPSMMQKDFSAAYSHDMQGMRKFKFWDETPLPASKKVRHYLRHYVIREFGGHHDSLNAAQMEAFAELFAQGLTGGNVLTRLLRDTRRELSHVIKALDYEMTTAPPLLIR